MKGKYKRSILEAAAEGSLRHLRKALKSLQKKQEGQKRAADGNSDSSDGAGKSSTGKERVGKRRRKGAQSNSRGVDSESRRLSLNVNFCDSNGWSPLHHACGSSSVDVVEALIKVGADIHLVDNRGNQPIHVAARKGFLLVVETLLAAGASLDEKNILGESARTILEARVNGRDGGEGVGRPWHDPIEEETWEEKLMGEMSDEEGGYAKGLWGEDGDDEDGDDGGSAWGRRGGEDDDSWRDEIAADIRKRQKQREQAATRGMMSEKEKVERAKREKMEEERQAEAKRILEEEREKDKVWREKVQSKKSEHARKAYEASWQKFASSVLVGIGFSDVPFPAKEGEDAELGKVLLAGVAETDKRKRIREEIVRWHPDKFIQRWGRDLLPRDKDKIMKRVKEISQALHAVYSTA